MTFKKEGILEFLDYFCIINRYFICILESI